MDFKRMGKKAAKKAKRGLKNAGGGDLLGELDEGNVDVIEDPTTGTAAKKETVSEKTDDKLDVDMSGLEDDLDMFD